VTHYTARGGMYSGRMDDKNFAFAKSSLCLVLFSVAARDGLDPREVNGEACTPLSDEACMPTNITFSVMRSMSIYFIDSSIALSSSNINARG
jgi:hypothetical protein